MHHNNMTENVYIVDIVLNDKIIVGVEEIW